MRHLAPNQKLLDAEFEVAFQRHGGRHGDHEARFDGQGTSDGELERDDGVAVAVADAVGAPVEGADVVAGGARADEVALGRGAAGHVGLAARVEGAGGGVFGELFGRGCFVRGVGGGGWAGVVGEGMVGWWRGGGWVGEGIAGVAVGEGRGDGGWWGELRRW